MAGLWDRQRLKGTDRLMLAIVRVALSRPYTFIVMAMLILIFGVMSWFKTPTDIFPNIGIPVVSAVFTYNGLPPEDMSGRIIYYYERTLSSQVNDIQHMESQSLAGYGVVKIFFQPSVNINTAIAQITAASQTVLKLLPQGITPPYVLVFNASSVPILQLALSSSSLSQAQLADYAQNFIRPQLATVAGAAVPSPYGGKIKQVSVDLNPVKLQSYHVSASDVVNALAQENQITPVGTEKIGRDEYVISLNDAPKEIAALNDLPIKSVDGTVGLHPRCRLRARRIAAADQHRARRRLQGRPHDDPQVGLVFHAGRHQRHQGPAAAHPRRPCPPASISPRWETSPPSSTTPSAAS